MAVGPDGEIPQGGRLIAGRLRQLGATVPQLAHEQAGQAIQVAVALGVPDVAPLTALDHPRAIDLVLQDREVAPQVLLGQLRQSLVIIHGS